MPSSNIIGIVITIENILEDDAAFWFVANTERIADSVVYRWRMNGVIRPPVMSRTCYIHVYMIKTDAMGETWWAACCTMVLLLEAV